MDVQSKENLFKENQNLVYFTINKYYSYLRDDEDMIQEGFLGLWKAVLTWNPQRYKFSTYAATCILNQIRMELRRRKKLHISDEVSLSTPVKEDSEEITLEDVLADSKDCFEEAEVSAMFNHCFKDLKERDKYILFLLISGYSQSDIAKELNCTRANVSRIKRSIIQKFQNKI